MPKPPLPEHEFRNDNQHDGWPAPNAAQPLPKPEPIDAPRYGSSRGALYLKIPQPPERVELPDGRSMLMFVAPERLYISLGDDDDNAGGWRRGMWNLVGAGQ